MELIRDLNADRQRLEKEMEGMKKNHNASIQGIAEVNKVLQMECEKLAEKNDELMKQINHLEKESPNEETLKAMAKELNNLKEENEALKDIIEAMKNNAPPEGLLEDYNRMKEDKAN